MQSIFGYDVRKYFDLKQANIKWNYISDDSKVIELIKVLYPIAKPIMDDLPHAYYFNDDTTPGAFLESLINTIDEAMPDDLSWAIRYDGYKDDYDIRVLAQVVYPSELLTGYGIEIDWFLKLPIKLQELAYDVIGLLQNHSGLLLFYGYEDAEFMIEADLDYFKESLNEEDADIEHYTERIKTYNEYMQLYYSEDGPVKTMERRINKPTRTIHELIVDLDSYNSRSKKSKQFIKWLKQGMTLLDDNLQRYTCPHDINEPEDFGTGMDEACVLHYSIDDADPIFSCINHMFSDRANNVGFMNFNIIKDLEETPIDELEFDLPDYPIRYTEWLNALWDVQKLYTD